MITLYAHLYDLSHVLSLPSLVSNILSPETPRSPQGQSGKALGTPSIERSNFDDRQHTPYP